ncbi:MAG: hypothetical protein ACP5PT_03450 [Brevinematia bacterium]
MSKSKITSHIVDDPNLRGEIEKVVKYVVDDIIRKNPYYDRYRADLIQEGIVKAIDPKKSKLSTFISRCVKNELINYLKSFFKISPSALEDISETFDVPDPKSKDYEFKIMEKEIFEFIEKNTSLFTNEDKEIFTLWMGGCKYKDIAKKVGKSKKYVDNSIQRTKKIIIRNFGL